MIEALKAFWDRVFTEVILDWPDRDWNFWIEEARRRFCRRLAALWR